MDQKKSNSSVSPKTKFLKIAVDVISPILAIIFNHCVMEGIFPDQLKKAEVVPIFKSGQKSLASNYRPISLLSPFAKIFENCLYSQLISFLNKNSVLYPLQYGFRENSSTEFAVSQIVDDLTTCIENKSINCSVFLDLAKAFNTVNHQILLKKLQSCGVRGVALKLMESFLADRHQWTVVGSQKSDSKIIDVGVPQGSTLGPLMFLIYINDLHTATNMKVRLFADDACLSLSNKDPHILQKQVNIELDKVHKWLKDNKLFINYKKSNFLIFTKKRHKHNFQIKLGTEILNQETSTNYLGITLDDKLNWEPHLNKLKAKLARNCFVIYKIKRYVNESTLKMLYYSFIHPHIQYGISTWGKAANKLISKIFILQKSVIKTICNKNRREPSTPLFKRLGILKLNDLYTFQTAKLMFKLKNGTIVGENTLTEISNIHYHNTRLADNFNFFISRKRTKLGQQSFSFNGPKIWTTIPGDLKDLNILQFKHKYKQLLIDSY